MIKIKATELKPGHIVQRGPGENGRIVVLGVRAWDGALAVRCAVLSAIGDIHTLTVQGDDDVWIEQPQLTVAQQRADELVALLRQGVEWHSRAPAGPFPIPPWASAGQQLLDEIDPPVPPTAQELAQALQASMGLGGHSTVAMDVLDRARKAGLV